MRIYKFTITDIEVIVVESTLQRAVKALKNSGECPLCFSDNKLPEYNIQVARLQKASGVVVFVPI